IGTGVACSAPACFTATAPRARALRRRNENARRKREGEMTDNRIMRRQLALAASAAAAGMFPIRVRAQQNYPNRPVRFILPFAAAGVADITARLAAEKLGDKLGQRFVGKNNPDRAASRQRTGCPRQR